MALSALDSDVQGCGISMDMGIDVQGYVDLVQLLSGIDNVDIWGRPSLKKVCFLDIVCTLYPLTFPCIYRNICGGAGRHIYNFEQMKE